MLSRKARIRLVLVLFSLIAVHIFVLPSEHLTFADRKILEEIDMLINQQDYTGAIELLEKTLNFQEQKNIKPFLERMELAQELQVSHSAFSTAMQYYNEGSYQLALEHFRKVKPKDVKNFTAAREKICELNMSIVKDAIKEKKASTMQ